MFSSRPPSHLAVRHWRRSPIWATYRCICVGRMSNCNVAQMSTTGRRNLLAQLLPPPTRIAANSCEQDNGSDLLSYSIVALSDEAIENQLHSCHDMRQRRGTRAGISQGSTSIREPLLNVFFCCCRKFFTHALYEER
eukprot:752035-Hanusia_phi.AAC.5